MKVLCIEQPGKMVIKDMPKPALQPGYAVIKMEECGICGSDVTAYKGVNPTMKYPVDGIGHEGVGIIEEIGENSKGLKAGDRVALEPYVPCNQCHMCKAKRFNNCVNLQVCGVHKNGMMAEYFLHPVQLLYPIPQKLSFTRATIVEPLSISLHGATRARVTKGDRVVVFGAGTIGLLAAFACLNYGAMPILVDVLQTRLDNAKELGIPHVFNSKNGDVAQELERVFGQLADAMIDCTGSPFVLQEMHNYVRHGGRIALVGWPHEPVAINTVRCMQKELDIYPCRNSNAKFPEAVQLVNEDKVPTTQIITKTIGLEEVEATIQDMAQNPANYMKVVVKI